MPKRFPGELVRRTRMMLIALDDAAELNDLRIPAGNRLKALKGDRAGQSSIRVNAQWRLCSTWTADGPAEVELVDYH